MKTLISLFMFFAFIVLASLPSKAENQVNGNAITMTCSDFDVGNIDVTIDIIELSNPGFNTIVKQNAVILSEPQQSICPDKIDFGDSIIRGINELSKNLSHLMRYRLISNSAGGLPHLDR